MSVALNNEELQYLRMRLKQGEYDGKDIMLAYLAIDELIDLRIFIDIAFQVHPNLDLDIDNYNT